MRILHLADLHLGKSVNDFSMLEDQRYLLEEILALVTEKAVDAVLIAGDVYDRSVPSEEAVKLLDYFLTQLALLHKKVFLISGNHDSEERLQFGSSLFAENGIYICGRYDGTVPSICLSDDFGPIRFWLLPYIKASTVGHYFPEADTSSYESAFRQVADSCELNPKERNVLLSHQFVVGSAGEVEMAGSESAVLNVGTIDKIPSSCFDAFDYVALGHIHRPQQAGRETCRYAGAPLKYSLSECGRDKTVPLITLREKGDVQVELLPLHPLREMRRIRGTLSELLEHAEDTDDYIYATLTDEETPLDAMRRLQEVYPHTMKLDYDNSHTRALADAPETLETENKSFRELMGDFYGMIRGGEPSDEEWEILEEVAREAGVLE